MKVTIELQGMEFRAFHGCLEIEREQGGFFTVDVKGSAEALAGSDRLEDTLDYGKIYSVVSAQMTIPSALLEHVAWRIASALKREVPLLEDFTVTVSKKRPPLDGVCQWSRVSLNSNEL